MRNSKEWHTWATMIQRCTNPKNKKFPSYGGRGIAICQRWLKFENFFQDMGFKPPSGDYSLERNNNDGNYEPGNCRWANRLDQGSNRRDNINLTVNGETHCIAEWSRITGIKATTLYSRIYKYKWSPEKAVGLTPIAGGHHKT